MHLFHIPECSIQNRNVHISVLNGAFWDMEQVHSVIFESGLLWYQCQWFTHHGWWHIIPCTYLVIVLSHWPFQSCMKHPITFCVWSIMETDGSNLNNGSSWTIAMLNSSPPSAAYMRQWIRSALVQIMAWRLFAAKPLSLKPMLGHCQLYP